MSETALTVITDSFSPTEMRARIGNIKAEVDALQDFFKQVMIESHPGKADGDYGIIPGTQKPTLLKPGAEKLAEYYGYAIIIPPDRIVETVNEETGFYRVRVTVQLVSKRTGVVMAEGVGEANTKEGRYRWRNGQRACPECGKEAIIKGRAEYGGGWVCFGRKGGCGAKWDDGDPAIEGQVVGKIENDDPFTLWNTVLKTGKKRGVIDAVLSATRSSGLFTQDLDDLQGWVDGEVRELPNDEPPPPAAPTPRQEAAARRVANGNAEVQRQREEAAADMPAERRPATDRLAGFGERDGKIGVTFMTELQNRGLAYASLVAVAPGSAEGKTSPGQWLEDHPDKTLKDLLDDVAQYERLRDSEPVAAGT